MSDCLIVGGGVIGMMSARALALKGAQVIVLDQRKCARESSWAGGGIISPLYPWQYDDFTNELSFASQAVYADLCQQLYASSGIDPQYQKHGLLMRDEFDTAPAKAWMKRYQIEYELHPQGAFFSHIGSVRNPRLLAALQADIGNLGVKIIEHTQAQSLMIKNDKVLGVRSAKKDFFADNTVICAGAWSSKLLNLADPVAPIKGQMIVIKADSGTLKHIILNQGQYLIPRVDGSILVGSTTEAVGFDRSTHTHTKNQLYQFACQQVPTLKTAKITQHWSGFRPATQSRKSLIARDKNHYNLFINTGHFRNGLNMAPESANRITQMIYANT